jgi:hypothetical protein
MRRLTALVLAGGLLALGAGWVVSAQTNETSTGGGETSGGPAPAGVPIIQPPPEAATPPVVSPPAETAPEASNQAAANSAAPKPAAATPPPPPTPAPPVRSPAAVLQALDKVTLETIRFAAPVNQRVRYKTLVFTVKACESTGLDQAEPQFSAYVVIDSQPTPVAGQAPPPSKQVYHGWMFSNSPGLHPLQHPIYDAWLIACIAAIPPA